MPSKASSPLPKCCSSPWSDSTKENLQAVTNELLSLTVGFLPSSISVPTPPPFPDNFIYDLEELSSLALSASQSVAKPPGNTICQLTNSHIFPVTSAEVSLSSPESLPQPFPTSTSVSLPLATQSYDKLNKPITNGIKLDEKKYKDLKEMIGSPAVRENRNVSDSTKICGILGTTFAVSEMPKVDSLPRMLAAVDEQEEEICEELLSIIQRSQTKFQDSGFYRYAPDVAGQVSRLHIVEDPRHDSLNSTVTIKRATPIHYEEYISPNINKEVYQCLLLLHLSSHYN